MKRYDVIIVGAGPAGLMAARGLAGSDVDFLVIDQKEEIGLPLRCGEGIRKEGFIELFGNTDHDFVMNRTDRMEVRCGRAVRSVPAEYIMLDRPAFEKWLSVPVNDRLKLGTVFIDLVCLEDCMQVITDKGVFECSLVILCNGCGYSVQKKFGLLKRPPVMVPCYGGIFSGHGMDAGKLYFFIDEKMGSIMWLFPKDGDKANIGVGLSPYVQRKDIRKVLSYCMEKNGIEVSGEPSFAGVFPDAGPISRTYADRLLVCGNAAGQVYAGSGEGIYFALRSGVSASAAAMRAVDKGDFSASVLKRYEKDWKRAFGSQLKAGVVFDYLLLLGMRYRKCAALIRSPSDEDLVGLFLEGRIPLRARLAFLIAKSCRLHKYGKGRVPFVLRMLWRFYAALPRRDRH